MFYCIVGYFFIQARYMNQNWRVNTSGRVHQISDGYSGRATNELGGPSCRFFNVPWSECVLCSRQSQQHQLGSLDSSGHISLKIKPCEIKIFQPQMIQMRSIFSLNFFFWAPPNLVSNNICERLADLALFCSSTCVPSSMFAKNFQYELSMIWNFQKQNFPLVLNLQSF